MPIIITILKKVFFFSVRCFSTMMLMDMVKVTKHALCPSVLTSLSGRLDINHLNMKSLILPITVNCEKPVRTEPSADPELPVHR